MSKNLVLTAFDKFVSLLHSYFGKLPPDLLQTLHDIRYFIIHEEKG